MTDDEYQLADLSNISGQDNNEPYPESNYVEFLSDLDKLGDGEGYGQTSLSLDNIMDKGADGQTSLLQSQVCIQVDVHYDFNSTCSTGFHSRTRNLSQFSK